MVYQPIGSARSLQEGWNNSFVVEIIRGYKNKSVFSVLANIKVAGLWKVLLPALQFYSSIHVLHWLLVGGSQPSYFVCYITLMVF